MLSAAEARNSCLLLVAIMLSSSSAMAEQGLKLMTVDGAQVVYDSNYNVNWLADANFATSPKGKEIQKTRGVAGVNPNGSMSFATAQQWVRALNESRYLGRHDWQLPTTPFEDSTCGTRGPGGASFGGLCQGNALGNLYYVGLQNSFPANAARFAGVSIGPFQNVELAYYWTQTSGGVRRTGKQVFSFGSGDSDVTEIKDVYYYALPMVPKQYGPIGGAAAAPTCSGGSHLALYTQGSAADQAVYDCETGITWLANANLAKLPKYDFGLKGDLPGGIHYNRPYPSKHPITLKAPLINGGAMLWDTARQWVEAMNAPQGGPGYLGSKHWQLPDSPADLRTLYEHLQLSAGDARLMSKRTVGPFQNLQPFFYWETCVLQPNEAKGASACAEGNAPSGKAGRQMNFDFTFGYGLLSTDLTTLNYFVMVYYPAENKAPAPPPPGPVPYKPLPQ